MRSPTGHPVLAALMDVVMSPLERLRPGLAGQVQGRVLELGVGTGLNLPHYPPHTDLHGIEPDPHMLRRARARAEALGLQVDLQLVGAESLPFEDESFDTVITTFVFCSVPEVEAAAAEALRVLRPGGRLLFAEHVASSHPSMAWLQRVLDPPWQAVSGGCSLTRDPVALFAEAGAVDLEVRPRGSSWSVVPVITARARKG